MIKRHRFVDTMGGLALLVALVVPQAALAGNWIGYMNCFANNAGTKGGYIFGDFWGVPDLATTVSVSNPGTIIGDQLTLQPNFNAYTNAVNDTRVPEGIEARAFWTNSADSGVTAGPLGNKWLEANTISETPNLAVPSYTFTGSVTANTLNTSLYTAQAFIKVLDPDLGFATVLNNTVTLPSSGNFSLTSDLSAFQNKLLQVGFVMNGLNANPVDAAAFGSVSVTINPVPEPSTMALVAAGVGMLAMAAGKKRSRRV